MNRICLIVVVACVARVTAQGPPANDTCATALVVSDGVNGTFNNAGANTSTTVSCSTSALDVWFRYTATRAGSFTIRTCTPAGQTAGSMSDTVLAIYSSCAAATPLACNDDSCSQLSSITINLAQGSTYFVRVASGFVSFPLGSFWLEILPPPATNEDCTSPLPSLIDGVNPAPPSGQSGYFFSCVNATTSQAIPTGCPALNEVWFQYIASQTGPTTIRACTPPGFAPGSLTNALMSVHPGNCTAAIACNDDSCGQLPSVTFMAMAGTVYKVQVGGFSVQSEGTFYLTVKAPANDLCADAIPLTEGIVAGNNALALTDATPPAGCGSGSGKEVWYSYSNLCSCPRQVTLSLCGANGGSASFDSVVRVFSGTCAGLAEVACNDDFCGTQSRVTFTAAPGSSYLISVGSDGGAFAGPFSLAVSHTCATASQVAPACTQGGGPGPTLAATPPTIGGNVVLSISGAGANAGGVLFFGPPGAGSTPLPGGCTFALDPFAFNILFTIATNGSGSWSLTAPIPNDPSLECATTDLQALLFPAGTFQVTSCLRVVIGH